MKQRKILLVLAAVLLPFAITGQSLDEAAKKGMTAINENALRAQLTFLASDWMEGRETGEKGEYISADYIASMLQLYGVQPCGDFTGGQGGSRSRSYFQTFQLVKSSQGDDQSMALITSSGNGSKTVRFKYNVD